MFKARAQRILLSCQENFTLNILSLVRLIQNQIFHSRVLNDNCNMKKFIWHSFLIISSQSPSQYLSDQVNFQRDIDKQRAKWMSKTITVETLKNHDFNFKFKRSCNNVFINELRNLLHKITLWMGFYRLFWDIIVLFSLRSFLYHDVPWPNNVSFAFVMHTFYTKGKICEKEFALNS